MSLRKSPTRTPAFLAANRANAQKCAGPRASDAKTRVARNALRHGFHARSFHSLLGKSRRAWDEFTRLYRALDAALLPEETEIELVMGTVLRVWALKLGLMRWAASPQEREEWFAQTGGVCPAPLQLLIKRPGWRVRVSVWLRWGRGRGGQCWQPGPGWKERRARLHIVVTVTASMGHPLLGCSRLEEVPRGIAPRVVFGTKPECARKHGGSENVITIKDSPRGSSRRANPAGRRPAGARSANGTGAAILAERLGPAADQDDPILRHIASIEGDLLSWLSPENAVLTGPRLSESEGIESWIDAFVTRWEKQHGPIPKKEVMPDEIAAGGSCLGTRTETEPECVRKQKG